MVHCTRRRTLGTLLALVMLIALTALLVLVGVARADEASQTPASSASVVGEEVDRRTEYAKTYLLSDGTFRTVFYQAPIHFKDDEGVWREINPSLVPTAGVDTYTTAAAPVEVTVRDEGAGYKPIQVETAGYLVTMNLLGYAETDKLVLGDTAIYTDVAPDTDVTYTALGDGVKEVINLASTAAPDTFSYRLTHAGLELRRDEAGQWALYRPDTELPLFLIGAVNACDSSLDEAGEPAWCDAASMTVSPGDGASTITYRVPRTWLDDPARVWPVKVDPSLGTRAPTDTFISSGYPSTSYGSNESLLCGKVSTAYGTCKSLVKFPAVTNTNNIPSNAHISWAQFKVRQFWQPSPNHDATRLARLTSGSTNWGDGSTWNSTTIEYDPLSVPDPNLDGTEWLFYECPGITQMWVRGDWPNKGFMLYQSGAEDATYARKFRSGEYSDVDYRPRMDVDWEQPAAAVSCDRSGAAYRVGDTAKVYVDLSSVADLSQITNVRMGINRWQTSDLTKRRGVLGWFSSNPGGSWVRLSTSNFYYFNSPTDYGSDHITPVLNECSFVGNRVTFAFELNDEASGIGDFYSDFGDCQDNDFDTIIEMSSGGQDWSSGWVHHNTNMDVQPTAPEHPTTDLGQFTGHSAQGILDQQALQLTTSDLAIASWGPQAALSRSYSSSRTTSSLTAPGWRFSFERCLTASSGSGAPSASENFVNYYDEAGDRYVFLKRVNGSYAYIAPKGFSAVLAQSGSNWTLATDGGLVSTFNSSGKLISEADRNNQTVTYGYTGSQMTSITAANGQAITITYTSGKVASASYATTAGTRQVTYATASPWRVTYFPSQSAQRKVLYSYDATPRLTTLTQEDWPSAGQTASETFSYSSGALTNVYLPTYNASTRPDARLTLSYSTSAADSESTATLSHYGATGVSSQRLITWREASLRFTEQESWLGIVGTGTLKTRAAIGWDGAYSVDQQEIFIGGAQSPDSTTEYNYESDPALAVFGKAVSVTDAEGHTRTLDYDYAGKDPTGRLASETSPTGTTTYNTYDANGNLTAVTKTHSGSSDKMRTEYSYDSYGRLTSEKQLISGTVTQNGSTFTVTNGVWAQTDYSNFAPNGEPQTTIARGVKLSHGGATQDLTKDTTYDAFGNQISAEDWGGRTTQSSTYDIAGRRLTETDAAGVVTHLAYDAMGNQKESHRTAAGTSMKADWAVTTYDASAHPFTVTTNLSDASGNATTQSVVTNTYDGMGRQLTASDSTVGGQDERWDYDAMGNEIAHWAMGVANYTDAYRSTRTSYDEENRETGRSEPGNTATPGPVGTSDPTAVGGTRTVYDDLGQVDYEISADKSRVSYIYNGEGNTTSEASTATGTTTSTYGIDGRLAAQTTQSGFVTNSAYDMLGRATGATGSGQAQTQTEYNTLGWVLQTVDANGVTTQNVYDTHGNVTDVTVGSAGTTHTTYDALNRVLTQTDPNGDVLTNTYDAFGNLHEEKHQDWVPTVLKDVVTNFDSLGRPTSESESVSGRSRTWTYPVNTPGGVQEALSYDATPLTRTEVARNARGMETSSTTTIASGVTLTRSVADTSGRDQADRWTSASLQLTGYGALTLGRSFDNAGRMATQTGAGFTSAGSYAYNATSGLKSNQTLPLALGGAINESYTYHSDGRLQTWGSATYTYDAAGNLTGDGATTFAYSTSGTPNRLVSSTTGGATTVYGWDQANAWRTSQGPTGTPNQIQYTYVKSGATTSNGRMTRYQNAATGVDASYVYDASGQRTKSTSTVSGTTTTTTYAYDGLTLLKLSAVQGSSSWRIDYLYDEEGALYGGVYRSPATQAIPTVFTVITNDHGDVLELLDANGAAFAAYRYDPWGKPVGSGNYATGVWTQATSLVASTLAGQIASRQMLRYASYAYDIESGLYYCSARYYDPATRQWTTGDPAKADREESAHQYCAGSPVESADPDGRKIRTRKAKCIVERFANGGGSEDGWACYLSYWVYKRWSWNTLKGTVCGGDLKPVCWVVPSMFSGMSMTGSVIDHADPVDYWYVASSGKKWGHHSARAAIFRIVVGIKGIGVPCGSWHVKVFFDVYAKPNAATRPGQNWRCDVIENYWSYP